MCSGLWLGALLLAGVRFGQATAALLSWPSWTLPAVDLARVGIEPPLYLGLVLALWARRRTLAMALIVALSGSLAAGALDDPRSWWPFAVESLPAALPFLVGIAATRPARRGSAVLLLVCVVPVVVGALSLDLRGAWPNAAQLLGLSWVAACLIGALTRTVDPRWLLLPAPWALAQNPGWSLLLVLVALALHVFDRRTRPVAARS